MAGSEVDSTAPSAAGPERRGWLRRLAGFPPGRRSGSSLSWEAIPVEELSRIEALPRDWPALGRLRRALWLNALAPGSGLIALQRPRLGLALAAGFLASAELGLLGVLVMPLWLDTCTVAASVAAAGLWIAAQALLLRRMGQVQDPHLRLYASSRIELAGQAAAAGEWSRARALLRQAAQYDDEQPELNWLLARMYAAAGAAGLARRQWRRLDQVDRRGRFEAEIREALRPKAGQGTRRPVRENFLP